MIAIILWGHRRACYLCEHIDESHVHLQLQFQGGGKRVRQMSWNFFQTFSNTLRQLPLSILGLLKSDQEPYLAPVALCPCIWAQAWELMLTWYSFSAWGLYRHLWPAGTISQLQKWMHAEGGEIMLLWVKQGVAKQARGNLGSWSQVHC